MSDNPSPITVLILYSFVQEVTRARIELQNLSGDIGERIPVSFAFTHGGKCYLQHEQNFD